MPTGRETQVPHAGRGLELKVAEVGHDHRVVHVGGGALVMMIRDGGGRYRREGVSRGWCERGCERKCEEEMQTGMGEEIGEGRKLRECGLIESGETQRKV